MPASAQFGSRLAQRSIRRAVIATTHQAIAFDALERLAVSGAGNWRRLFLHEAELFALGTNAPDAEFRDFKNHVLLPRDGFWGGAPGKAQSWCLNLSAALRKQEWRNAAYCAGVLSHYLIDIAHPFHTGQSEAENDIHTALDACVWSLYPTLAEKGRTTVANAVAIAGDADFLSLAMADTATRANADYERLHAHFDLARAVADPTTGLDAIGQRIMAEAIARATALFAAVLDRVISDAAVSAPSVSLTATALRASLGLPLASLARFGQRRARRVEIAAIYDELMSTGHVVTHLAEEFRVKRELYDKEIAAKRPRVSVDNVFPFEPRRRADTPAADSHSEETSADIVTLRRQRIAVEPPRPAPPHVEAEPIRRRADVLNQIILEDAAQAVPAFAPAASAPAAVARSSEAAAVSSARVARAAVDANIAALGHAAAASLVPTGGAAASFREKRSALAASAAAETSASQFLLSTDTPVAEAPSITTEVARKIEAAGIDTVGEFLSAHPIALAARLDWADLDADILAQWQDEARLQLTLPELSKAHAQMLVAAGYRSTAAVAEAETEKFCADVLAFAASPAGVAVLLEGTPDIARIREWSEAARLSKAA